MSTLWTKRPGADVPVTSESPAAAQNSPRPGPRHTQTRGNTGVLVTATLPLLVYLQRYIPVTHSSSFAHTSPFIYSQRTEQHAIPLSGTGLPWLFVSIGTMRGHNSFWRHLLLESPEGQPYAVILHAVSGRGAIESMEQHAIVVHHPHRFGVSTVRVQATVRQIPRSCSCVGVHWS